MNQDFSPILRRIISFRDARDWQQFHNPKDMAISLVLESTEFLEHFQWKSIDEITEHLKSHESDVSDELADVLYWVLLIANDLGIDLVKAAEKKMTKNEKKYPTSSAKGKHTKYTELQSE